MMPSPRKPIPPLSWFDLYTNSCSGGTETSLEELKATFGEKVCRMVEEVTDNKALSKAERKQRQIQHAAKLSQDAVLTTGPSFTFILTHRCAGGGLVGLLITSV